MKKYCLCLCMLVFPFVSTYAKTPDCTGVERWPAAMASVHLKNAGIIEETDFSDITVKRLASEKIGSDLYRQVHSIRFITKQGKELDVITVNDASNEECSMSGVDVYRVTPLSSDPTK